MELITTESILEMTFKYGSEFERNAHEKLMRERGFTIKAPSPLLKRSKDVVTYSKTEYLDREPIL